MIQLQATPFASFAYQPDLKGPLVGPKKSSHAITEEYAKADPVYVAKTAKLPQTYSHYRPVLGDGNCGWRAIGYSYFETLQKLGRKDKLEEEIARMMSLTSFIETWSGYQEWLFEDMREEVLNLLRDLAATVHVAPTPNAESLIQLRFNDEEISNAIIYYFRLLASAWLKANAVTYRDFILDGLGVDNYSKNTIEPAKTEIEHLGMTLLIDVLLKPVGIAVEIVYLDRSEGTDVNSYIIQAEDESGTPIHAGAPVVHLLYRPGHYDILYKGRSHALSLQQQQIIDGASAPANIQVNRAGVLNRVHDPSPITNFNSFDLSGIAGIPSLTIAPLDNHSFTPAYTSLSDCKPVMSPSYSLDTLVSTPTMPSVSPISAVPSQASSTPIFPPAALPIHGGPSQSQLTRSVPPTPTEAPPPNLDSQFRHSKYEYESDWNDPSAQQSSFQTNTFKNSHYNTAHYNNPNFQPEEWCADDEKRPQAPRRDSTRHKSAST
jgi:ubiquitin thioesterase protein OTUB1